MSQLPTPSTLARRLPSVAKLRVDASDASDNYSIGSQPPSSGTPGQGNGDGATVGPGTFVRQDVAIWDSGVAVRGAENAPMIIRPEDLVLHEVIGRGASSYVQKATHVPTGQVLALKIINIFDKTKRDQLIREITALYDADCDALISFWGAFTREGCIVLALEYMDAGSLADVIARHGPIPEPVLAGIAFQMLWGLGYLRVEKRLHRDLKPGNVLLSSTGACKLGDFGLSAELANSIGMAQTYVGTCKYMAPERISHHGYSFPSDIWSAGLILLEGALGRFPLPEASSYIDMVVMIVEVADVLEIPANAVSGTGEAFTPEFRDFIAQALRKHPESRSPADVLLSHPWLARWGMNSLEDSWAMVSSYVAVIKAAETKFQSRKAPAMPASIGPGSTTANASIKGPNAALSWTLPVQFEQGGGAGMELESAECPAVAGQPLQAQCTATTPLPFQLSVSPLLQQLGEVPGFAPNAVAVPMSSSGAVDVSLGRGQNEEDEVMQDAPSL